MPETPHLRTSERVSFKRCQQQWQWAWRDGLTPKNAKPDARWFGTGIHLALAERYKYVGLRRGKDVLKVWREYVGDEQGIVWNLDETGMLKYETAKELGEAMLGAYLDRYGLDERWHVISAEQPFEIPIPHPSIATRTLTYYNGTFDLVALDQEADDSLWLWDHKTSAAIRTGHLSLDDQAGSYWAVAADVLNAQGLIKPGQKLDGILYNFLRKAKPDARPVDESGLALNKNGSVSKVQPAANFLREEVWRTRSERRRQIEKIQAEALQMAAGFPVTKNPTKDCEHGCEFFQMCELHEQGDDWKTYRDAMFTTRDPYAAHRETSDAE